MIYELTDTGKAAPLFGNWDETLIWSCLQGIMGKIYADAPNHPTAAMAILGDFIFFAGEPNVELISYKPRWRAQNYIMMVPQNESWEYEIRQFYGKRAKTISRYAIKKEPSVFDKEKLKKIVASLPEPYQLSMIDKELYRKCLTEAWSADLVSQFPDYENYRRLGIGAVICKDHRILSGASSYSRYKEGIEIEIDTRPEYRRQGLAYICGAKLILECLKRNLYPSWDAHNMESVALAQKLGYHYSHPYRVLELQDY